MHNQSLQKDKYQHEMKSLRDNLNRNCPKSVRSAPRNLDRMTESNDRNNIRNPSQSVCPISKVWPKIQMVSCPYCIKIIFRGGTTLRKCLFRVLSPTEYNKTKKLSNHWPSTCGSNQWLFQVTFSPSMI